jgi:hypothetical protein
VGGDTGLDVGDVVASGAVRGRERREGGGIVGGRGKGEHVEEGRREDRRKVGGMKGGFKLKSYWRTSLCKFKDQPE